MKRKISALPAIIIRVTAIALTFWLGVMCLITYGGVQDVNNQLQWQAWNYLLWDAQGSVNYNEQNAVLPGYQQYCWAFMQRQVKRDIDLDLSFRPEALLWRLGSG